ncbi:hypothetical protein [Neisseria perflava]|nr:hypothetical protein [Neisseria perflava]MCP1659307.1 uncharacterized protein YoxC [Neisseria perflava]MCP1772890.1 uncharacterized protein YoxC [Neisseria perflava]
MMWIVFGLFSGVLFGVLVIALAEWLRKIKREMDELDKAYSDDPDWW